MANNLGRISGQLLKDNLTRNGHDLSFHAALSSSDDPVLKLNVTNRYISVNSDTTLRDLFVNGRSRTPYLEVSDELIGLSSFKVSVSGNTILSTQETSPGSGFTVLNLSGATSVDANIIDTDNIRINGNVISTKTLNTTLDFAPAGSLDVYNKLNVTGNLWAKETIPSSGKGNITLDGGTITFGSDNADTISFAADINTDINPNVDELYSIGSIAQPWDSLYIELINGTQVSTGNLNSGSINLTLRQGKIWFVATNGLDTNVGDHQNSAFATIKHALDESSAGDTVYIYPGTYTEIFPLTVKVGVTVKGTGIRSVTVQPTVGTQSNNAFLLNGESTISDLTVKDFYAPGYAFAFAPGFTVTSRSPYVQNITVITKGSVTSLSDPRGFDEGDAGGGAYVDGSLATSASKEASMLFHSVTFITPGVDALVMTNGVRVEWLNSFTYFANRGLYATQGTLGLASLGIRFGAEIRSIGSANVYGNYGAEANGASALMYLIQHNFAYIGAGKDVTNDPSLNIQANETVELASGKIYYQSLDNKGNFKVGDAFGVSFDTGLVTINGVSVTAGGVTSINFVSGTDETVIDATQIATGNVKFSNNLLTTILGPTNLISGTDEINLNANTDVTDNLDIIGNFNIDGKLTIGNAFIDIVRFEAPVEFDLRPKTDDDFTLGGPTNKSWDFVYLDTSYIGNYKLENATISTVSGSADVELRANGTGKIYVNQDNVEFDQDLTVSGTTNLGDNVLTLAATVTGTLDHTGLLDRTGDTGQTGTYNQTGYLDVSSDVRIVNVTFIDNTISTVTLDSNLELGAASTGKVKIPSADVQIDNNLFVTGNIQVDSLGVSTDISVDSYSNGNIEISLDLITTTVTDSDLEFRAAGTGKVYASQDSVKFDQDLTVDTTTALKTTVVTGEITQYGDYLQTGNALQTGNREITNTLDVTNNIYFDNINIVDNRIFTTNSNDSLELRAAGTTGKVIFNAVTEFSQNVLIGTLESNGLGNSGTITSDIFSDNDIEINDNYITTTVGDNNLIFNANGSGNVRLEKLNFGSTTLSTVSNNDNIILSTAAGSVLIDAATALKVPVGTAGDRSVLTQGEFRYNTTEQLYKGFNTTSITFGGVYAANRLTNVVAHPTNNTLVFTTNNLTAMTVSSTGIALSQLTVDNNLVFNTNTIAPATLNNNIQLTPNGNGALIIDDWAFYTDEIVNQSLTSPLTFQNTGDGYVAFTGTSGFVIPSGDTASQPANPELGDLRYNTELEVGEIFNGVEYRSIAQTAGNLISEQEAQDISALMNLIFG
jgi:hypothetical protein